MFIFTVARRLLFGVATLTIVSAMVAAENPVIDSTRALLFTEVQPLIYNNHFDSAGALVDVYQFERASDPAGWLVRSSLYLARMSELEDVGLSDDFKAAIDSVMALTESDDDSCSADSPLRYLLRGHARTNKALYEAKFGSDIKAVKDGWQAAGEYEEGLKCDSTFYDIYLGLGGFHFWKSVKGGILRKVRILNNDIAKGIDEIELARDSSLFSQEPARNALIWIMIEQGAFDTALAICDTQIQKYPHGTMFKWAKAKALYESGSYNLSIGAYNELHEKYRTDSNYYNLLECEKMIVECYVGMLKKKEAAYSASRFREYEAEIPQGTRERQMETIRFLEWWADKISFYE